MQPITKKKIAIAIVVGILFAGVLALIILGSLGILTPASSIITPTAPSPTAPSPTAPSPTAPSFSQIGNKLVGSMSTANSGQGTSISLSGDGNTLAIGGQFDNGVGATWIFTKSETSWSQQAKLVGTGGTGAQFQGASVSLSGDGNTLAIGGFIDTWIFTRSGTSWSQLGTKLVLYGQIGSQPGQSVSLSSDGNTLAIGKTQDNNGIGATWIFTRDGSLWSQQAKLVGSGGIGTQNQGYSVSLSANGNTLAVGGLSDNNGVGATWIFTRNGTTWTQQAKLVGSQSSENASQGVSVSLSSDGNTLAIGGFAGNITGATWIFTRNGTTWTQQGAKIIGSGGVGTQYQGFSVSLSANGNTLAVGGLSDNNYVGATWIFIRSGTSWTQLGEKLTGSGGVNRQNQGSSVSLDNSGNTLAIGGVADNNSLGATWIFSIR